MIRLFDRQETQFNHNKTILTPLSCYVIEEANGMFELEAEFPKNVSITEGDIIKAPSPRGEQLFRIYRVKKSLKGKTAYARHIFYDLSKNFLVKVELNNESCFTAIQSVLSNCETSHNFIAMSDVLTQNSVTYKRINPIQAIIGDENSILNLWGGNLIRNNFNISIKANGMDRGYEIRMGKNLIGIDADIDESNAKTRIYPTVELDDSTITLPEKYVDSPLLVNYGEPIIYTEEIKLTDEQKALPVNDIYNIMRDYCNDLFKVDNIDKPVINYKVDFIELSKTEQYKDLAILEQLDLNDIVTVNVSHLDINVKARVIKYKYDCLKERYDGIELGDFSPISNYSTDNIVKQLQKGIKASQSAAEYATNVITGNKGGYVVIRRYPDGKPYEILIMDTEDINTAQNVFRLNNSGLGFSRQGYNGIYETAMTIDGHINAKYIDVGELTTILLKSMDDSISINLSNGTFALKDSHGEALITSDGVANSDNFSMTDNIQNGYPLTMPFNIDDKTSNIKKVLLKYTQQSFRTYSTTASSGGGTSATSSTNESTIFVSPLTGNFQTWEAQQSGDTPHSHYFNVDHGHAISVSGHGHTVYIAPHSHALNFGIQEQAISDYSFTVYVDGNAVVSVTNDSANAQGIIDLTAYVTAVGWHTIEMQSTTLKRISAQVNVKSYIRS
ncbi:MAG: phage tail protein [Herbinix sp.]|nr:phage tail protein [Herbinix sp.]